MKSLIKNIKDKIQGKVPSGTKRSSKWPKVRSDFLKKNPKCAVCEGTDVLEVHHITPFHENPDLELEETNLIVLCESKKNGVVCHQFFGHCGNYRTSNKDVKKDTQYWNQKLKSLKNKT